MRTNSSEKPVTIVVRRRVRPECANEFETVMRGFIDFALSAPGNLGIHVLRPAVSESGEYTVVDRFADFSARRAFTETRDYLDWMRRLRALSEGEPHIEELGGLAGWFTLPDQPHVGPPPRWKMAIVTLAAVFPLAWFLPRLVQAAIPSAHPLLLHLVINAAMVAALTWLVMPLFTRTLKRWLFGVRE